MIKITRTYHRPEYGLPWHLDQPYVQEIYTKEFTDHVARTYSNSMISRSNTLSEDKDTLTFESTWVSMEAYQQFLNDPICQAAFARRNDHTTLFGIVSKDPVIVEV